MCKVLVEWVTSQILEVKRSRFQVVGSEETIWERFEHYNDLLLIIHSVNYNLIEPKNNLKVLSFSMTLVCDWLKIFTISNQPIREKNSNFLSCILQWRKLVSFFVFLFVFSSSSSYFKILFTTPHIMLKIYQLPYLYNKLHMINKFYCNPTSGHLV